MGEDIPVVFGADRRPGVFRRMADPPLRDRIGDLPQIRRDLRFFPVTFVIMPVVAVANLYAGVKRSMKSFELVKRRGYSFLRGFLLRRGLFPRPAGGCWHN